MLKIVYAPKANWLYFCILLPASLYAKSLEVKYSDCPLNIYWQSNSYNSLSTAKNRFTNQNIFRDAGEFRIIFVPGVGYEKGSERNKIRPYAENISMALYQYTKLYTTSALTLDGSHSPLGDMFHVLAWSRKPAPSKSIKPNTRIYEVAEGIAQNWIEHPIKIEAGEQFNLMGFSQGSVTTAQALIDIFRNPAKYGLNNSFKVNYLLLGGSTICKDTKLFKELLNLKDQGKIGVVIYDEAQLPGDIVTGLGSKSLLGAIVNMFRYLKELSTKEGRENNVHYNAASDKDFSTTKFVIQSLENCLIH